MTIQSNTSDTIKVWDPLVRVFHWSLVILFLITFVTEDDWMNLHVATGYAVAMLVGFRLLWGVIGTRYARFTQFVKSPTQVFAYIKKMLTFDVPHYIGHNPAAAAMIISLLISIFMVSVTGMAIIATQGEGPLAETFLAGFNAEWMEEAHEFFANFTVLLVILHIAGVFFSSMLERENLIKAMITGRKKYRVNATDSKP
ncbi:MAG: cytochrome b/b6 domain-containing protein [Pseudomonadales bacterium]|nr:cytochrome b/b6 domain-containing protein [Pseudomonadales bacterium]